MGNSLGAQLLKAGLVNKKQINKAKQEQYKKKKKQQRGQETAVSESQQRARQAQAAQKEQARKLNRELQLQNEQKEIAAQIGQMIGSSRIKTGDGDLPYNFVDNNKIKKLYITKAIRDQLSKGQLAIVKHQEQYDVVPTEVARKIGQRNQAAVLVLNEPHQTNDQDDPYAEYPNPDDIEW
ncbi:DUF2058 domain-containing protein [Thermodesulfobacteriota bacterium]